MDLERYHLAAWQNEVWRVAWGPDELVPMFHATQANTQHCRGVSEHIRVGFFVQLRDRDDSGSIDANSTIGCVEHDGIGVPRTAFGRDVMLANKVEAAASVHKPLGRTAKCGVPGDRGHGHSRQVNAQVAKNFGAKNSRQKKRIGRGFLGLGIRRTHDLPVCTGLELAQGPPAACETNTKNLTRSFVNLRAQREANTFARRRMSRSPLLRGRRVSDSRGGWARSENLAFDANWEMPTNRRTPRSGVLPDCGPKSSFADRGCSQGQIRNRQSGFHLRKGIYAFGGSENWTDLQSSLSREERKIWTRFATRNGVDG